MAQQHQTVVLGVLQAFAMRRAGQPVGERLQYLSQWQLLDRLAVAHRDVGQVIDCFTPAEAKSYKLRAEGVEVGGLRVDGGGGGVAGPLLQLLDQGLELTGAGDELRL